jgi:antitoxin (DNA-binding transcriptional repressor) of toxin-antitoxin stability system
VTRGQTTITKTIDLNKESPNLEGLLSIVARGTEVLLTQGDIPIARLAPVGKRVAGLHAGSIWISEQFDEPLPDEFWIGNA